MRSLLFIAITVLFLNSCAKEKERSSSQLIEALLKQYPVLQKDHAGSKNVFTLTREIKDNNWKASFELYESGPNSGIIIIRKNKLAYTIPLFEDEYTEYWLKDSTLNKPILFTNFEKEIKAANRQLQLTKSDFLFCRYLFEQVLQLREAAYPDPCMTDIPGYPFTIRYSGSMVVFETVMSRDSITLLAERAHPID